MNGYTCRWVSHTRGPWIFGTQHVHFHSESVPSQDPGCFLPGFTTCSFSIPSNDPKRLLELGPTEVGNSQRTARCGSPLCCRKQQVSELQIDHFHGSISEAPKVAVVVGSNAGSHGIHLRSGGLGNVLDPMMMA